MSDGDLCHKYQQNDLAYKRRGYQGENSLIFKGEDIYANWAIIIIDWTSATKDVDICGYWTARPDVACGWNWSSGSSTGVYQSHWESGDDTDWSGREILHVRIVPWETGDPRTYRIHFNVYAEGAGNYIRVTAMFRGVSVVKESQNASEDYGRKALATDPSCLVTFGEDGTPLSIV